MKDEETILPYFLRHYETFVDKIFIINDKSEDKTKEIAKQHPLVEVIDVDLKGKFPEHEVNSIFENSYKKYSRGVADWVIIADADEFIYNTNIKQVLSNHKKKKNLVLKVTGYDMFSKKFPTTKGQIYEECNMGIRNRLFDKAVVFNPEIDIEFAQGRHAINKFKPKLPPGVSYNRGGLIMLHYRYLSSYYSLIRLLKADRGIEKNKWATKIYITLDKFHKGIKNENNQLIKVIK